jgi:uncharacterized membrane protein
MSQQDPYTPPPPSGTGLQPNLAAALSYIWIVAVIFLFVEPYNKDRFVRFHAFQSIFVMVAEIILWTVLGVSLVGVLLLPFVGLGGLVIRIICGMKAYNNESFKLPLIGDMAETQARQ